MVTVTCAEDLAIEQCMSPADTTDLGQRSTVCNTSAGIVHYQHLRFAPLEAVTDLSLGLVCSLVLVLEIRLRVLLAVTEEALEKKKHDKRAPVRVHVTLGILNASFNRAYVSFPVLLLPTSVLDFGALPPYK